MTSPWARGNSFPAPLVYVSWTGRRARKRTTVHHGARDARPVASNRGAGHGASRNDGTNGGGEWKGSSGAAMSDRARFEAEIVPLMGHVHRLGLRLTRRAEDAADLVQAAMLRAYRRFHGLGPGTTRRPVPSET